MRVPSGELGHREHRWAQQGRGRGARPDAGQPRAGAGAGRTGKGLLRHPRCPALRHGCPRTFYCLSFYTRACCGSEAAGGGHEALNRAERVVSGVRGGVHVSGGRRWRRELRALVASVRSCAAEPQARTRGPRRQPRLAPAWQCRARHRGAAAATAAARWPTFARTRAREAPADGPRESKPRGVPACSCPAATSRPRRARAPCPTGALRAAQQTVGGSRCPPQRRRRATARRTAWWTAAAGAHGTSVTPTMHRRGLRGRGNRRHGLRRKTAASTAGTDQALLPVRRQRPRGGRRSSRSRSLRRRPCYPSPMLGPRATRLGPLARCRVASAEQRGPALRVLGRQGRCRRQRAAQQLQHQHRHRHQHRHQHKHQHQHQYQHQQKRPMGRQAERRLRRLVYVKAHENRKRQRQPRQVRRQQRGQRLYIASCSAVWRRQISRRRPCH